MTTNTSNEIAGRVTQLAAGVLEVEKSALTMTTAAADVQSWDSFAQLNLLVAIEDEFDIELEPREFAEILDLRTLVEHVSTRVTS